MTMPGFTAVASLYDTREAYFMPTAESGESLNSVQTAFTGLDFNPNCGPCQCRIVDVGIRRYFFCHRTCYVLLTPGPGLPPQRIFYTVPCTRWG
jgi:hypothetical protein